MGGRLALNVDFGDKPPTLSDIGHSKDNLK